MKIRNPTRKELKECTLVDLSSHPPWNAELLNKEKVTSDKYEEMVEGTMQRQILTDREINVRHTKPEKEDPSKYEAFFLHPGKQTMVNTLKCTTQYGMINMRVPMRQHYKSRNPLLNRRCIMEPYATDTWFSTVTSYQGYNCAQVFCGIKSHHVSHYGLKSESDGPEALLDFFRQEGVPTSLTRDNSKMQAGNLWNEYMKRYWVKDDFIEPYHSNQNPAERAMAGQKEKIKRIMIESGCEPEAWFDAAQHVADVSNHTSQAPLQDKTPTEKRDGYTPDISGLVQYKFWDLVCYKTYEDNFPEEGGGERVGHWLGHAIDYGDKMCYKILDIETRAIIIRSMVRPYEDSDLPNSNYSDLLNQEKYDKVDEESFPLHRNISEGASSKSRKVVQKKGKPNIKEHQAVMLVQPEDLIDLYVYSTYKSKQGNDIKMRGQVRQRVGEDLYRVAFDNGKQRVYDYEEIIDMVNRTEDDDDVEHWTFDSILKHCWSKDKFRKGKMDVLIKW